MLSIQMSEIYFPLVLLEVTSVLHYAQSLPCKICLSNQSLESILEVIKALIFKQLLVISQNGKPDIQLLI